MLVYLFKTTQYLLIVIHVITAFILKCAEFASSPLIVSVKLNCFSWKKTENKKEVAMITGGMKEPWAARQVC